LPRPPFDGITFRTYRGDEDIPAIVGLLRAVNVANGVTRNDGADSMRLRFRAMTRVDPREDVVLAEVDGSLVALSTITWDDTTDGERHYRASGWVHPDWRRRGIGGAMWDRNEARIQTMAEGHADAGRRISMVVLPDADAGGLAGVTRRGYHRVRIYHHMVRPDLDDIEVPPLPPGLDVRPPTMGELRPLWEAAIDAFSEHFGAEDTTEAAYRRWRDDPLLDLSLLHIAFDGDEIAGGVHGHIDPGENEANGYLRGWTDPIYVRKRWRRRGLATALMGRTLVALRDRGMTSAQLDVDSENENQALTLYEQHGFRVDRSASEWHKPLAP
jgi:ribosomal protein S18 acetylase RimI-like enzyme